MWVSVGGAVGVGILLGVRVVGVYARAYARVCVCVCVRVCCCCFCALNFCSLIKPNSYKLIHRPIYTKLSFVRETLYKHASDQVHRRAGACIGHNSLTHIHLFKVSHI